MITTGLVIACIVCAALSILGFIHKSLPIIFISSLGYVICGLQIFQQTEEMLPLLLLIMLSMGQFLLLKKEAA